MSLFEGLRVSSHRLSLLKILAKLLKYKSSIVPSLQCRRLLESEHQHLGRGLGRDEKAPKRVGVRVKKFVNQHGRELYIFVNTNNACTAGCIVPLIGH